MARPSKAKNAYDPADDKMLAFCADYWGDPLGFVWAAFDWREGEGPDDWQADLFKTIGEHVREQKRCRIAIASGHGIGKTAAISQTILWFLSTHPNPQVVVTANTGAQLANKTWRELSVWKNRIVNKAWFTVTATKCAVKFSPETWFATAQPWSKERPEAFAGTHAENTLVIYDEASLIEDAIWDVTEGAMTTPGAIWLAFGNPTRNTGRFYECFHGQKHRWLTKQIDSRNTKVATKDRALHDQWVEDFGEDSDFVRVRLKGEFPRQASAQFIGTDIALAASKRTIHPSEIAGSPVVIGVDVARFGDDQTVIYVRQGLATLDVQKFRGLDTMAVADQVIRAEDKHRSEATFIDVVGVGAGVVDRMKQLGREPIPVNAGERAEENAKYFNKRVEMWARTLEWLKSGGCIPDDKELLDGLTAPEYCYDQRQRIVLERKDDLKRRGLPSPDTADALAHTFCAPVGFRSAMRGMPWLTGKKYDPFTYDFGESVTWQ